MSPNRVSFFFPLYIYIYSLKVIVRVHWGLVLSGFQSSFILKPKRFCLVLVPGPRWTVLCVCSKEVSGKSFRNNSWYVVFLGVGKLCITEDKDTFGRQIWKCIHGKTISLMEGWGSKVGVRLDKMSGDTRGQGSDRTSFCKTLKDYEWLSSFE